MVTRHDETGHCVAGSAAATGVEAALAPLGCGFMSDVMVEKTVNDTDEQLSDIERLIISFIQKEIQDKSVMLTRATRREDVAIDSIDVVNVIFAIEEKLDVEIELTPDAKFETVGDLVDTLVRFIPPEKRIAG